VPAVLVVFEKMGFAQATEIGEITASNGAAKLVVR
jgi:hypothetical protein